MSFEEPNAYNSPLSPPSKPAANPQAPPSGAVTAVMILNYVFGGLNLICGGLVTVSGGLLATLIGSAAQQDPNVNAEEAAVVGGIVGGVAVAIGVVIIIFALPLLIAGYGVGKRAQWGRTLTIVLGFISAALAVLSVLTSNPCGAIFDLAYAITVLVILFNARYAAEFS